MKQQAHVFFVIWLVLSLFAALICGLNYLSVQQVLRQSANDPQVQMAEDLGTFFEDGNDPKTYLPDTKKRIDISKSLAAFIMVFDESGLVVASSGQLQGQPPHLPDGVIEHVKQVGESRFTWEPLPGVRSAVVLKHYNGGIVLVGRSLREVEDREVHLLAITVIAYLATVVGIGIVLLGYYHIFFPKKGR